MKIYLTSKAVRNKAKHQKKYVREMKGKYSVFINIEILGKLQKIIGVQKKI